MSFEEKLEKIILEILKVESDEDLLGEPDLSKEDERDSGDLDQEERHHDEQSVAGAIAGYTLPLGASNKKSTLKQRGETSGRYYGGAKPVKKKKDKNK
jgi:hypothetical protein